MLLGASTFRIVLVLENRVMRRIVISYLKLYSELCTICWWEWKGMMGYKGARNHEQATEFTGTVQCIQPLFKV